MKNQNYMLSKLTGVNEDANLVFCAFERTGFNDNMYSELNAAFPNAEIIMFSTSGHFIDDIVNTNEAVVTALSFDDSRVEAKVMSIKDVSDSEQLGKDLGASFDTNGLKGICLISDGGLINGTDLMIGINSNVLSGIPVFGGMAGDDTRFEKTLVGLNNVPEQGNLVAIGFYGEKLSISTGVGAGWTSMGLDFKITKSKDNVLYELDGQNAYDILYELLKPENQDEFTTNTLFYPFLLEEEGRGSVIRTPISVKHEEKELVYAGNMPVGAKVSLTKSNTMKLLDAVVQAAENCKDKKNSFVFATSCVGRRVVLDEFTSDEYKEIKSVFGEDSTYFGFYSYGEFAQGQKGTDYCSLHNQTFTLAAISED